MGIPFGSLGKLGLPSLDSLPTAELYGRYFANVENEEDFQCAVIRLCSEFNSIMPGKHYTIDQEDIKKYFDTWKDRADKGEGKRELVNWMLKNITEYKPSSLAMISTGCVAPAATIAIKKSADKFPQLKWLRLDVIPSFVIVPTVTLVSVIGVRVFSLNKGLKSKKIKD